MTMDTLTAAFIGNSIGLVLLLTLFFSNKGRIAGDRDLKTVFKMIAITATACICDPIAYVIDGKAGLFFTILSYISNSWLFIANMLVGRIWVGFVIDHLNIPISYKKRMALDSLLILGFLVLLINPFYPLAFSINNNIYERGPLFWIFIAIAGIYMVTSVFIYHRAKQKSGVNSIFSIYAFLIPVVIGLAIQTTFYGVSVIWPSIAIAMAGIMTSLKNEIIFMDKLTGIYNRVYLEYLQKDLINKKNTYVTGIMIDLNGFKSINDKFGHATGDEALIIAADILRKTVGEKGNVMRYAGDEFVILVNTVEEEKIEKLITNLNNAFNYYNEVEKKPYKLSISYGYAALDLKNQTMNDFMNTIDKKMYDYKANYYKKIGADRRK